MFHLNHFSCHRFKRTIATDAMRDVINEWIEENTDEQDRLINLVVEW